MADSNRQKEEKSDYSWWLFRKERRVATAKELWDKPEVKKAIEAHNALVGKRDRSKE